MATDPLEQLLTSLDVRVHAFAMCEVELGYELVFDPSDAVIVHYVLKGGGFLKVDRAPPIAFERKHLLIVPPGRGQTLAASDEPGQRISAAEAGCMLADGLLKFAAREAAGELVTVCATITATQAGGFGLFERLQGPLVEDVTSVPRLSATFDAMIEEMQEPGLGARALIEGLMKQALLLVLRSHLVRFGVDSPLFFTLKEPRLMRAVTAVIAKPGAEHTLASLAAEAGMSRSAFAKKFADAYGQSPFTFVQKVRLRHAAHLLAVTDLPIKMIARSVGYASRSQFSRAFRVAFGADPSSYRDSRAKADSLIAPVKPPPPER